MGLRDEILEVVAAEPGLSADEIFLSLSDDSQPSGSPALLRHLRGMRPEIHEIDGRWYSGAGDPAPEVDEPDNTDALVANLDAQREVLGEKDLMELERWLRHALRGRRLIAELGLDSRLNEQLTDIVEDAVPRLGVARLARTYPHVFMAFLVGHGVYGYRAGSFWGQVPIDGIDIECGREFERLCKESDLEDFSELLVSEQATRYVAPILAHGGIPQYCLDDFFTVLLRGLRIAGSDAEDLLSYWRTRKSAFAHVDKPVARFLLYGGDVAIDFLARCVEAVEHVQRHGEVPSPQESGLPPYVLVWLNKHKAEVVAQPPASRKGSAGFRPAIVLDPWSPLGPEAVLPPVPRSEGFSSWRFTSAAGVVRRDSSTFEPQSLPISPQKSWTFEYVEHEQASREWTFEGLDSSPALLFNPINDELVPATGSIRLESVWILAPSRTEVEVITERGTESPHVIEEAPSLTGPWSGYSARHVDLTDCRELRATDGDTAMRVKTRKVGAAAQLLGDLVDGVATADGDPVYSGPVRLLVPAEAGLDPEQWNVLRTGPDGASTRIPVSEDFTCELTGASDGIESPIRIVVHGALGSDSRFTFAVVPGLRVVRPPHFLLPASDRAQITVSTDALVNNESGPVVIPIEDDSAAVDFTVADAADVELELRCRVSKLLWAMVDEAEPGLRFRSSVPVVSMRRVVDGEISALAIRVGDEDIPLQLHLVVDGQPVQVSDKVKSGRGEGRWTFDLAPFRDVLRTTDAGAASFVLRVGEVPVTVVGLRASVAVRDLQATGRVLDDFCSINVSFTSLAHQRDRVLRLWSVSRPWEGPVVEPVEDGSESVLVSGWDRIVAGSYLAEIAVDDGWTRATRPRLGADNVALVRLGDDDAETGRLTSQLDDDPFRRLEALLCGHNVGEFPEDELVTVASPALEAVRCFSLDPDPQIRPLRGAHRALHMLMVKASIFGRTVADAAESGRLSRRAAAHLTLLSLARRPYQFFGPGDMDDAELRRLWNGAPAVAALVDLVRHSTPERADRLQDLLAWNPVEGADSLFTGQPVTQQFAGARPEQLRAMRSFMDLLPKSFLAADALVEANFDWLIRAKERRINLDAFWAHWKRRVPSKLGHDAFDRHIAQRVAPDGSEAWASLPRLTFAAAAVATSPAEDSGRSDAVDLLLDAMPFAPALVERDLVLTRAIHACLLDQESP